MDCVDSFRRKDLEEVEEKVCGVFPCPTLAKTMFAVAFAVSMVVCSLLALQLHQVILH